MIPHGQVCLNDDMYLKRSKYFNQKKILMFFCGGVSSAQHRNRVGTSHKHSICFRIHIGDPNLFP